MRLALLLLPALALLASCTMATRARSPAEILGWRQSSSYEMTIKEDGETDDCTELKLQRLRNEFLQKELDACKDAPPVDPAPAAVSVPVQVKPVEIELVPKVSSFPAPKPLTILPAGG